LNQSLSLSLSVTGGANGDAISLTPSAGCTLVASGSTQTYDGSGTVSFNAVKFSSGTSCTLTVNDTTTNDTGSSAASSNVTLSAFGPAAKLGFVGLPTTATAGVALTSFKVASEDTYGNVVTTAPLDNITILAGGTGCTLGSGVNTVPISSTTPGNATFTDLVLATDGSCTLTATDPTTGYTTGASPAITVSGGAPAKLAFTLVPPANVLTTGTVITAFKVSVEDSAGNVDTATTGSADSITVSSPCLAASVTAAATAGVATFSSVEFATTGACVLTATDITRTLVAATATSIVGAAQAALTVTTKSGYLDVPLTLATAGGTGTGAVTYTVTNGTATGCAISTTGVLTAKSGGTCTVTAYKAAATTYAPATSVATTVTISSAPKAVRLVGAVWNARKTTVTVTGYNFIGRPKITSNVAGFKATVSSDSGKSLRIVVTVTGSASKPGVKVMTIRLANGKTTSVRYSLH
jgi:hypothetical protein